MKFSFLFLTFFISITFASTIIENSFSCYKQVNNEYCLLQGIEKSKCTRSGHGFTNRCEDDLTLCKACNTRYLFRSRIPLLNVIEEWCIPQGGFIAEFNVSCTNFCAQVPTQ